MIFQKKGLETPALICKLVSFFVCHYKWPLTVQVQDYLDSKKLTLDEWLNSVKNNRRGDILYLYFLSMVTGRHTCVHLKNGVMWSTLKAVPMPHNEHVSRCDLHLVYLGFGTFLHLIPRPNIEVKEMPVLGHITNDDPNVKQELIKMAVKQEKIGETSTTSSATTATASAGSASQLTRVESELCEIPPKASAN